MGVTHRLGTAALVAAVVVGMVPLTAAANDVSGALIQVVDTGHWDPPSTDPSGIVWQSGQNRFIVVDSEIEEIGALFVGVNMWFVDATGGVLGTGSTFGALSAGYSDEPTGLGFDAGASILFVSDDTGTDTVYSVTAGVDGQFGTSDDGVVAIDLTLYGINDAEDPEYDTATGHLFVLAGNERRVVRIDPVDGLFGNGDDIASTIDLSHLGPTDFEGMTSSSARGTLLVGARTTGQVFEVTRDGELVRTIDLDVPELTSISGLTIAPSSNDSSVPSLWVVDRGADTVADGQMLEFAVADLSQPLANFPPTVDAGDDFIATVGVPTALSGAVVDDGAVASTWTATGPGSITIASVADPSSGVTFGAVGVYVLELSATDGEFSSRDRVAVTVTAPPNSPPTLAAIPDVTVPEDGVVTIDVDASDPDGDTLSFLTSLPPFASFDPVSRRITVAPHVGDAGLYDNVGLTVSDGDTADAPTFVGASSSALTSTTGAVLKIDRPAGVQPGDVLVAQIRHRDKDGGGSLLTALDGWVHLTTTADGQANHTLMYRIASDNEPVRYPFDQNSSSGRMAGAIAAYRGANPGSAIHAWTATSSRTALLEAPGVVTTMDDTTILRLWGWRGFDSLTAGLNVPPSGVTQGWSEQSGRSNATDRNMILGGHHTATVAGAVPAAVATGSSSIEENRRSGFTLALAPAATGAAVTRTFTITVTPTTQVLGTVLINLCQGTAPSAGFVDVSPTSTHSPDIDCLTDLGIARGVSPDRFDPTGAVARWQMALFIARAAHLLGADTTAAPESVFTDVGWLTVEARAAVNTLVMLDVTTGTAPGVFSPAGSVPRWQMALFLTRLWHGLGYQLPVELTQPFTDLEGLSPESVIAIHQLADMGVTRGTTTTTFSPHTIVTREQMASFIARFLRTIPDM